MKKIIISISCSLTLLACTKKESVDLIVTNGNIYTVNDDFDKVDAFAVKDGKFVAVGTSKDILDIYETEKTIDAKGQTITPGLIDGHCHFYGLGLNQQVVDLVGTKSFDEVVQRIVDFQEDKKASFIQGRGWDQNDWKVKEFPVKDTLDILFPDTPLAIERVDGHAFLANQKALDLAGIDENTKMAGGSVVLKNGKPTGILVDRPMSLVEAVIPQPSKATQIRALIEAENICFSLGLTTVNDAGLSKEVIYLIDSLQNTGDLKMRVYAMASNYPENLDHFLTKGKIKTDRLNVRSVKVYGDGALGSRGATLKEPYSDHDGHFGAMITPADQMESLANRIVGAGYQMNTHAIGDSANIVVLRTYKKALKGKKDMRWKVEHAQVITDNDFDYFNDNIIPSVQPTHATSDMYWAGDRLGEERVKGAYAFKTLLNKSGTVVLGTDFPVERVSPFLTFYAAVARKDLDNYPEGGFQMENALSREETLKGMTIWAAHSNFEEDEKGSIEVGKFADFVILDKNIMEVDASQIPTTKVEATFLNGEKVN
ncbi:amidohydrolase [Spongiivirga sp. MCCC 1A20706]|uniref:amidohydrolase n=1 Tax=Spongiivirga sp. MCCC 1A20706 TaxID=3160963 RepID=UPI003977D215